MPKDHGTTPLTVDSAADAVEALLTDLDEDGTQDAETQPPAKAGTQPENPDEHESAGEATPADEAAGDAEREGEAAEGDEGESDPQEDGEADDQSAASEQKYKLKLGDEEIEVTIDELKKGYLRQSDYTRKTMAIAEERKMLEADREDYRAARDRYVELVGRLAQKLQGELGTEPDPSLRETDPVEYAAQWAAYQQRLAKLQAAQAEQERVAREQAEEYAESFKALVKAENEKLLAKLPEWSNPEVRKKEQEELRAYGQSLGWTEEELRGATDHRAILVLRKAMLFDRMQAKAGKVKEQVKTAKPAPVVKPGAQGSRKPVTEETRARQRFAKTGRLDDAAAVIEFMLD